MEDSADTLAHWCTPRFVETVLSIDATRVPDRLSARGFVRHRQPEMMDQPGLPKEAHRHALDGLARLNRWTGVARSMYAYLKRAAIANSARPLRILDIASGSGDLPVAWARLGKRDGLKLEITTLDISEFAVETQDRLANQHGVSLTALQRDCLTNPLPDGFDVVTNSLFFHHLDEADVQRLVAEMTRVAQSRVVVCDLERSRINLGLVAIGARLLSRSPIVHNDASLSVRGAFTRDELQALCASATSATVCVRRVVPCRMMLTIDRSNRGDEWANDPVID